VAPPIYTTKSTNTTFVLNLTAMDQSTAEQYCIDKGGHLAAYVSSVEQNEVEQFYIKNVSS
jgi:hypothetical protein